nr:MAG TPA: hypothetical protein [Caudoviricetes sp.]
MAQYRVKALLEVEFNVKDADKASGALEKAEKLIFNAFLNPKDIPNFNFKSAEILMDDYQKEES